MDNEQRTREVLEELLVLLERGANGSPLSWTDRDRLLAKLKTAPPEPIEPSTLSTIAPTPEAQAGPRMWVVRETASHEDTDGRLLFSGVDPAIESVAITIVRELPPLTDARLKELIRIYEHNMIVDGIGGLRTNPTRGMRAVLESLGLGKERG